MFLHKIDSNDSRFKPLEFHDGMNLLLADKTEESETGDSRNGAGKTSFVRILRYLLGGNLDSNIKKNSNFASHSFRAFIEKPDASELIIERYVRKTASLLNTVAISKEEWTHEIGESFFGLNDKIERPTANQLIGQLVRTYFLQSTKTHSVEPDWESGIRIGYFLGLSPEILNKAAAVAVLEKQKKALKEAASAGLLEHLGYDEAEIRASLASLRRTRDSRDATLRSFRVDEQYLDHQKEADAHSLAIRDINDEALAVEQRCRDLSLAIAEEAPGESSKQAKYKIKSLYEEIGLILPDTVTRRFDEVSEFHSSVVRNRHHFLQEELVDSQTRLSSLNERRSLLDAKRAEIMELLNRSMALETFWSVEKELLNLDVQIKDYEVKLKDVQAISNLKIELKALTATSEASLRAEMEDCSDLLDEAIALFMQLGREIYRDRNISLLVEATQKGLFKVEPKIDGDSSSGISEVKIFLLDLVCIIMGIKNNRAPRFLVHDSQLFDSMDDRQLASCLNIGARLAEEYAFQYIVTINTDRLEAAEKEGFDRRNYPINMTLTDYGDSGGLFGFRFA